MPLTTAAAPGPARPRRRRNGTDTRVHTEAPIGDSRIRPPRTGGPFAGCFADEYHWRKGVGPRRAVTLNPNWGGVTESNAFGTHEFMDFLDQIGAEAYVSVNVGSGTPKEGAEWLEYLTAAQPTDLDPNRPAAIEASVTGVTPRSAAGETLTAAAVDSVNTFEAPGAVAPRPISAKVQGGKVLLTLEPRSVTVISVAP